jgi:ATP adenylyltransferase/5',5'''-P-1,P-4-tetraphosphate phosphorylase II
MLTFCLNPRRLQKIFSVVCCSMSSLSVTRFDINTITASSLSTSIDEAFTLAKTIPDKLIPLSSLNETILQESNVNFLLTCMSSTGFAKKNIISPANLISNEASSTTTTSIVTSSRSWPPLDSFADLDDGSLLLKSIVPNGQEKNLVVSDQAIVCEILTKPLYKSATHRLLYAIALNKFPARDKHLVLISRKWSPQSSPLDFESIDVLWTCVTLLKGVAFFNGGFRSGASQPRRHTQFIPYESLKEVAKLYNGLIIDQNGIEKVTLPIHSLVLESERLLKPCRGNTFTISLYKFKHRFAIVRDMSSNEVYETYKKMLNELDLPSPTEFQSDKEEEEAFQRMLEDPLLGLPSSAIEDSSSHNVVVTVDYMFVVPRSTDGARDGDKVVGINALLFTGLALVRQEGVSVVKSLGCFEVMRRVSFDM